MNNEKMFEIATRNKMRFPFKGLISVEDLWDLSVVNLDSVFKALNSQIKNIKEESLLDIKTEEDETLTTMIEIVKYIVGIKLDEEKARKEAKAKKEQKQKIMEIMSTKKDEALQNMSLDELQKMLNEL